MLLSKQARSLIGVVAANSEEDEKSENLQDHVKLSFVDWWNQTVVKNPVYLTYDAECEQYHGVRLHLLSMASVCIKKVA